MLKTQDAPLVSSYIVPDHVNGIFRASRTPLVTFMFDDGHDTDNTKGLVAFNAQGEVAASAVVTSLIGTAGRMTTVQLVELQDAGWEILSHGVTHVDMTGLSESDLIDQMKDSRNTLIGSGLDVNNWAYPLTTANEATRKISQRYYRSARGRFLSDTQRNRPVLDTHQLTAVSAGTVPGDLAGNLASLQTNVDDANDNGEWLIIYLHEINDTDVTHLNTLIDYVQAKGDMPIVTIDQALDLRENIFEAGDIFTGAGFAVSPRGEMVVKQLLILGNNTLEITNGGITIDDTADSSFDGVIYKGASRFLHNYHDTVNFATNGRNTFCGNLSGNFTLGATASSAAHASDLTGYGESTLDAITTGGADSAFGRGSCSSITTGSHDSGSGNLSLFSLTSGSRCSGFGSQAGRFIADGATPNQTTNNSEYIGYDTRASADGADAECVIGYQAIGLGAGKVVIGGASHTEVVFPSEIVTLGDGGTTDYTQVSATGDITFNGAAGLYPRLVSQNTEPAAGTGATQIDTSEAIIWDKADTGNIYLMFNDAGTPKKVELV